MTNRIIRGVMLLMSIWSSIFSGLGWANEDAKLAKGKAMFTELRQMSLTTEPSKLNIVFDGKNQVWGVVMEQLRGATVVSLTCLADGSTSFYFSNGGGIIGMGEHQEPREASKAFISKAADYLEWATITIEYPLPSGDEVQFYFRTFKGVYKATTTMSELESGKSSLTPLYASAQDVITQCRLTEQKIKQVNG